MGIMDVASSSSSRDVCEYMAVKPLIVPTYRYTLFFKRVCNACNNNFPKLLIKASKL